MLSPKRPSESATEMVQVVLPNDANPLGYILGGTVMHLIDIAGAIACHRHTRSLLVTAAVDGLQFLHPIKVGDLIILKALVTAVWSTSLEVEVEVFSEETLTGVRRMTSRAFLTFVATDRDGHRLPIPGLILETPEEKQRATAADGRRAERLKARKELEARLSSHICRSFALCVVRELLVSAVFVDEGLELAAQLFGEVFVANGVEE